MKRAHIALVAAALLLVGCESSRTLPNGRTAPCIGLNGAEDAHLRYEYSVPNIILGAVFWEAIVPPVIVVLDRLKCPVGAK